MVHALGLADLDLLAALIHPDDREWVMERFRHAFEPAGGGSYSAEFRILRVDDGAERWLSDNGRVYFDSTGRPTRAAGTVADITERRRAVEVLQEGEERYRALVETAPQAMFVHRQGTIMLANREALALFAKAQTKADAASVYGRRIALIDDFLKGLRMKSQQLGQQRGPVPTAVARLMADSERPHRLANSPCDSIVLFTVACIHCFSGFRGVLSYCCIDTHRRK